MQGLMLAAGMGKRLGRLTNDNTKCMLEVAGEKLVDRAIEALRYAGIRKLVVVVGYKGENLIDYLTSRYKGQNFTFEFIFNRDYDKTNNIYSLYLAKKALSEDDTVLLESDLIYDKTLIKKLVDCPHKNVAAVARYKDWMDGTVVTLDDESYITEFIEKNNFHGELIDTYYKTVNVYKLSRDFSANVYMPFLGAYITSYGSDSYYETTLKVIAHLSKTKIYAYELGDLSWYEIDDMHDLDVSEVLFEKDKGKKYDLLASKYGGYWRYEGIKDYCYLVNPYFPGEKMYEEMARELKTLIGSYPSGLDTQNMHAERMFSVDKKYLLTGNGAAELINCLGRASAGKTVAVSSPSFNEYIRCFSNSRIKLIDNSETDYGHDAESYLEACGNSDMLCVCNPDNPSGAAISEKDMSRLLTRAAERGVTLVVDESFSDFRDDGCPSLMNNETLKKYPNLIVIKSIGKSFGVGGLRLGVLASANAELLKSIRADMQVWNINSLAEYFMQIYTRYSKDYVSACKKIAAERAYIAAELGGIKDIKVYPSQANFIMIDLKERSSRELCEDALSERKFFLKDLSSKNGFKGKNFIRVAVLNHEDNVALVKYLKEKLEIPQ